MYCISQRFTVYIPNIGLFILLQLNRWTYRVNINRSQKHECGNWERGRAASFLGIHKSDLLCSANVKRTWYCLAVLLVLSSELLLAKTNYRLSAAGSPIKENTWIYRSGLIACGWQLLAVQLCPSQLYHILFYLSYLSKLDPPPPTKGLF
jgi:hypothetical protein